MKLFVGSLLLMLCMLLFPLPPEGMVKCTCRPSPPGGVTQCQPGQIASCKGKGGVCMGSCFSPSAQLQPMQYSAELLSYITGKQVKVADLQKDPKAANEALRKLVEYSERDKSGDFKWGGIKYFIGIGLSDIAKSKIKAALGELAMILKAQEKMKIRIPIGVRP